MTLSKGALLKHLFVGVGAIACIALLLGAFLYWKGFSVGKSLDRSSKAYIDDALPKIFANWSPDELLNRVSPENRGDFDENSVRAMFSQLSELGSLKTYEGSKGFATPSKGPSGFLVTAVYRGSAIFQNGSLNFAVKIELRNGYWTIDGFQTDPPVFNNK